MGQSARIRVRKGRVERMWCSERYITDNERSGVLIAKSIFCQNVLLC